MDPQESRIVNRFLNKPEGLKIITRLMTNILPLASHRSVSVMIDLSYLSPCFPKWYLLAYAPVQNISRLLADTNDISQQRESHGNNLRLNLVRLHVALWGPDLCGRQKIDVFLSHLKLNRQQDKAIIFSFTDSSFFKHYSKELFFLNPLKMKQELVKSLQSQFGRTPLFQ